MHARGFAERVAATDPFLLRRLRRAVSRRDPIAAAVAWLARSGGGHRVSALATDLGCSERTLRRRFRDELGLSVKRFARITRFQRAYAFLQASARAPIRIHPCAREEEWRHADRPPIHVSSPPRNPARGGRARGRPAGPRRARLLGRERGREDARAQGDGRAARGRARARRGRGGAPHGPRRHAAGL